MEIASSLSLPAMTKKKEAPRNDMGPVYPAHVVATVKGHLGWGRSLTIGEGRERVIFRDLLVCLTAEV